MTLCHMQFKLNAMDDKARSGLMTFQSGEVATPAFMPVGTYGTVKGLNPEQILDTGAEIILGNAFHLMLRPGIETIKQHGGLHDFIGWQKPILTDSGVSRFIALARRAKSQKKG